MIRYTSFGQRLLSGAIALTLALPPLPLLAAPRVEIAQAASIKTDAENVGAREDEAKRAYEEKKRKEAEQQKLDEAAAKRRMDAYNRGRNPYSSGAYNNDPQIQRQKLLERQAELKKQEQERERLAKEKFDRDMRNANKQSDNNRYRDRVPDNAKVQ
ncbi:MAG: hypothetical protein IT562_15990, partial [Alphaproteobacteria bacterium]|nr:hypothetical protein [Alphaproteobacteria bacterium]